jgi:hypothetical protein
LDIVTRGIIERSLDAFLEQDILEVVNWIFREAPVKSREDLILGYVLGSYMRYASDLVEQEKRWKIGRKQSEQRFERQFGKEKGKEEFEKFWKGLTEAEKDVKPIIVNLATREKGQLRDMLIQRIPSYRRKIYRELNK